MNIMTDAFEGLAPRRAVKTYTRDGHEVYTDTGRPVDENLGTHVVLWIVDDAEAWAAKIEAEGDALVARYPKDRIAKQQRDRDYESAAQVRAEGAYREVHHHHHSLQSAQAEVAELYRAHSNPGVRYEIAEIIDASACATCNHPTIYTDGQWRHHLGRYPSECVSRPQQVEEEPRQEGEFEIGGHYMICGYCEQTEVWPQAVLWHLTMTGSYMLGVEKESGALVVLAEATTLTGQHATLPHPCEKIPDEAREKYADVSARVLNSSGGEN